MHIFIGLAFEIAQNENIFIRQHEIKFQCSRMRLQRQETFIYHFHLRT